MEIDEAEQAERRNEEVNNNDFELEDGNLDENGNKPDEKEKEKKVRKPVFKLDALRLIDNPNGLKLLYKDFVTDNEKNIKLRGEGKLLSDFTKVIRLIENWHL